MEFRVERIIDFHDVALNPGLKKRQSRASKRKLLESTTSTTKTPSDGSGID